MVQGEHDPATPIEGARRAPAALAGSRTLTVTNEGDHGLYSGGNSCVDDRVESYLVDGVVPAANVPRRADSGPDDPDFLGSQPVARTAPPHRGRPLDAPRVTRGRHG
jgi:hypothetical protein